MMAKNYDDFLKDADWSGAIAALSKKGETNWSAQDYINLVHALCFQVTKVHNEGNYDDAVAAASKALVKNCQNNDALCIRAYAYYLNNNYEAAIIDCKRVIERASCDIDAARKNVKDLWAACPKQDDKEAPKAAVDAQEAYCKALRCTAFSHELLGIIYTSMDRHLEASEHDKLALLSRQTDIVSASPLLMDAYRNARAAVKGF